MKIVAKYLFNFKNLAFGRSAALSIVFLFFVETFVHGEDCSEAARVISAGKTIPVASGEARKAFEQANRLCPSLSDSNYYLGLHFLAVGDTSKAKESFDKAYQARSDMRYRLGSARAALESGAQKEAKEHYSDILSENPDHPEALQGLAVLYYYSKEYQQSEELLRRVLQIKPNKADLFVNLGMTLEANGKLDEALVSYRTAISKSPQYGLAYQRLAQALLKKGKYSAAEKASDKAGLYLPNSAEVWLAKAGIREANGDLKGALDAALKALGIEESRAKSKSSPLDSAAEPKALSSTALAALINSGILYAKLGSFDEALSKLKKAVELQPQSGSANSALGWFYLKQAIAGKTKEGADYFALAEQVLRRAVEINSQDAFAHNNLGVLLENTDRKKLAAESFARAKEIDSKLAAAVDNYKRLNPGSESADSN